MSSPKNLAMANDLRKLAAAIRQKAAKVRETRAIKCAQILTAAQGLSQLQDILKGVR
jgi:hypothetical protein